MLILKCRKVRKSGSRESPKEKSDCFVFTDFRTFRLPDYLIRHSIINLTLVLAQGLFLFIFSCPVYAQTKINTSEILREAELKRMPWAEMSVYTILSDSGINGASNSAYHIFFSGRKALIVCTASAAVKGNLLLLQNHDLWLYFKMTRQPVKITPLQRLSGSVSFVDLARLDWTTDYRVDSSAVVSLDNPVKQDAFLLHLVSVSPEVPYKKIDLWINKNSKRPIRADVFLVSGKIYKSIRFIKYETIGGKEINTQMEFTDYFNKGRISVITFSKPKMEKDLPNRYFIKESLPDLSREMGH
jgi:hypothetical protein